MKYFTSSDLKKIARNTNYNNHVGNYEFIAKKIHSPLEKEFKRLQKSHPNGYTGDEYQEVYKKYQELMGELERKSPEDYKEVYSRL